METTATQIICQVDKCRTAWSHVTAYHLCERCNQKGHGSSECGQDHQIYLLMKSSQADQMPHKFRCDLLGCQDRNTHHVSAHRCSLCGRGHPEVFCPRNSANIHRDSWEFSTPPPINLIDHYMGTHAGPIYVIIPAGFGHMWIARRSDIGQQLETLFMDNDTWGQYGQSTDCRPQFYEFCRGYTLVE